MRVITFEDMAQYKAIIASEPEDRALGVRSTWDDEFLKELLGSGKTLLEVMDLGIPVSDRIWVMLTYGGLDQEALKLLACDIFAGTQIFEDGEHPSFARSVNLCALCASGEATVSDALAASMELIDALASYGRYIHIQGLLSLILAVGADGENIVLRVKEVWRNVIQVAHSRCLHYHGPEAKEVRAELERQRHIIINFLEAE